MITNDLLHCRHRAYCGIILNINFEKAMLLILIQKALGEMLDNRHACIRQYQTKAMEFRGFIVADTCSWRHY